MDVLTTSVYGDLLVRGVVPLWFGCIVSQDMSDNAAIGAITDSSADSCSNRIVLQRNTYIPLTIMIDYTNLTVFQNTKSMDCRCFISCHINIFSPNDNRLNNPITQR